MVQVPLRISQNLTLFVGKYLILPLTAIEAYVIRKVKEKRISKNWSQLELSQAIGYSDSFVAHVEATSKRAKYNLNHLNKIAKALGCSPKEFLPEKPFE